jgi:hypothetical protein
MHCLWQRERYNSRGLKVQRISYIAETRYSDIKKYRRFIILRIRYTYIKIVNIKDIKKLFSNSSSTLLRLLRACRVSGKYCRLWNREIDNLRLRISKGLGIDGPIEERNWSIGFDDQNDITPENLFLRTVNPYNNRCVGYIVTLGPKNGGTLWRRDQCNGRRLKVQRIPCIEDTKQESKGGRNTSTFSRILPRPLFIPVS